MNLEQSISSAVSTAVADAINKQLSPLLEPLLRKLDVPADKRDLDDPHYATPEAAKILGVKNNTMEIWRHRRRKGVKNKPVGPEYVVFGNGRAVRYKRSVLLAFMQHNPQVGLIGRPSKLPLIKKTANKEASK